MARALLLRRRTSRRLRVDGCSVKPTHLLRREDSLDEPTEHLVRQVEVAADDHAGDDDDDGALDDLVLTGPLDLPQLADRLADEACDAAAPTVLAAGPRRGLGPGPGLGRQPDGLLHDAATSAAGDRGLSVGEPPRSALRSCLASHYLVSR